MKAKMLSVALVVTMLIGCASNSGVVPSGDDTYVVSRQAATGFSGLGTLKADAIREANQYCQRQFKTLHVISATEAEPPFIFGNFPKADVRFRCDVSESRESNEVSGTPDRQGQNSGREDVYTELEMLNDLRVRGLLTDAEFDAEKKRLLKGD